VLFRSQTYSPPIVFGEVLIDRFPDGSFKLGGAPFNVAWHLHGFETNPLFISAVSDDDYGKFILNAMQNWGMDSSGVQIVTGYPTGRVNVSFTNNEPSFDIAGQQAYDHINADECIRHLSARLVSILYFGSLAQREQNNRNIIKSIVDAYSPLIFNDINLRSPWQNHDIIQSLLKISHCVKMNIDEFISVVEIDPASEPGWLEYSAIFLLKYELRSLIITAGSRGCYYIDPDYRYYTPASPCNRFIDSVGAGDAFSAVAILGLLHGWNPLTTIRNASEFASYICGIQGAVSSDRKIYGDFLRKWHHKVL